MLGDLVDAQLKEASEVLSLPQAFIRKDYYVTKAIAALSVVDDDYFGLAFQGGTSLSKAYKVTERLSEDIDFRIFMKPKGKALGKNIRRRKLRDFRRLLITVLMENTGFTVDEKEIKVFYEGRFMTVKAEFEKTNKASYLRPHIAIDFFLGEVLLSPVKKDVTSLIKTVLKENSDHRCFSVSCVSLDETAAEKWVALTRRVLLVKEIHRDSDRQLVRHLYDLFQLQKNKLLSGKYIGIAQAVMEKDAKMFGSKNETYMRDPLKSARKALHDLHVDKQWEENWNTFLRNMVYSSVAPSLEEALVRLEQLSAPILARVTA